MKLEGCWGDTDSIREQHSVSQCDRSASGIRFYALAPPSHAISDRIQPPLLTAASSDAAAISAHLSGGPLCLHRANRTLSAPAPNPLRWPVWSYGVHLMKKASDCCPNAGKIILTHFFLNVQKHDSPWKLLFIDDKSWCGYGTIMMNPEPFDPFSYSHKYLVNIMWHYVISSTDAVTTNGTNEFQWSKTAMVKIRI